MHSRPATNAAMDLAHSHNLSPDEALFMQQLPSTFLLAAATGQLDLTRMAREELASRGLGTTGKWVGFDAATATWGA